jgi:hypothetical protein
MKFFIPDTKDTAQAESVYEGIRKFHTEQQKASLGPRRIYSVRGIHDGKAYTATVGHTFGRLRETVVAILFDEARKCYLMLYSQSRCSQGYALSFG